MVNVRRAVPADGEAVRRILFSSLCEYGIPADPTGADAEVMVFGEPTGTGAVYLVAEEGGEVVGSAALVPHHGKGSKGPRLTTLCVRPDRRGRGVGRELLRAAVRGAAEAGHEEIFLAVRPVCREAVSLFEAEGWLRGPDQAGQGPERLYSLPLHRHRTAELSRP
ncbi:GNAT family N-acetyltransferase [Streptomyces sp. TRM49041]|uniref:GNAT family N-acetyltransferase n=1 Tax=Streptomyces sp. TRM49041 TaxID=2603216 RepID=UPI0011EE52C5|nr:GNAT family N-acetyltransferase [Streptomyces sp. TRM49041]